MHLSRYIQSKTVAPNVTGAYHPFGHEVTFLDEGGWQALERGDWSRLPRAVLADLRQRHFLVDEGFEETVLDYFRPPVPEIAEMWMILVQSCNMACRYCVVEGNVQAPERRRFSAPKDARAVLEKHSQSGAARSDVMSIETADAAIDTYSRLLQTSRARHPRVTLYGGEPLLNKPVIRHAVPRLRAISYPQQEAHEPVQILVITNGQIYDEELTELFRRHRVSVSVSLDGMKHHHDSARVNHNGGGTFDKATRSLRRYREAGLNTAVCTTIGTHNVDDLPEIADYFADEFGVPVEFQVPFDVPFANNSFYLEMEKAAPKAMEAYSRLRARGMLEGLAARRLIQMARGNFHHRDCSAVGGQFVVAPDGMVGPCHSMVGEREDFEGNVRDGNIDPKLMPRFQEWQRRQPVNMPECHGCSAIGICGGGCPYNAKIKSGSIWAKDPQQCGYMHYLIDWFLDDCWSRYGVVDMQAARAPLQMLA
jgi:uncharacterized protein